jgi:hypothetical protein
LHRRLGGPQSCSGHGAEEKNGETNVIMRENTFMSGFMQYDANTFAHGQQTLKLYFVKGFVQYFWHYRGHCSNDVMSEVSNISDFGSEHSDHHIVL